MKKIPLLASLAFLGAGIWIYRHYFRTLDLPPKPRTMENTMQALTSRVHRRMQAAFHQSSIPFPPARAALLAFKEEKRLDLYAAQAEGTFHLVRSWPILAASGTSGIKTREGDRQVPEGFYRIELLNPNSRFHVSLRVNYPNAEDTDRARRDGRDLDTLGGDIMIHGGSISTGCLAIGDHAIEEVFYLAARTGLENIRLFILPRDFRTQPVIASTSTEENLYRRLKSALQEFPPPVK